MDSFDEELLFDKKTNTQNNNNQPQTQSPVTRSPLINSSSSSPVPAADLMSASVAKPAFNLEDLSSTSQTPSKPLSPSFPLPNSNNQGSQFSWNNNSFGASPVPGLPPPPVNNNSPNFPHPPTFNGTNTAVYSPPSYQSQPPQSLAVQQAQPQQPQQQLPPVSSFAPPKLDPPQKPFISYFPPPPTSSFPIPQPSIKNQSAGPQVAPSTNGAYTVPNGTTNGSFFDAPDKDNTKHYQKIVNMLDGMQTKFDSVFQRMDTIESRLAAIEIATKEVVNNQRNIQVQQRKIQDAVEHRDTVPKTTTVSTYSSDESRKVMTNPNPVYIPAPAMPAIPPAYSPAPQMPALVPVTQIREPVDQYKNDLELAKKLQAAFDQETTHEPKSSVTPGGPSTPTPTYAQTKPSSSGYQECPICQSKVLIADLEAHVEQHFEEEEAIRIKSGKGTKDDKKDPKAATESGAKSFFTKLFGTKEEDKKTDTPTPSPSTTSSTQSTTSKGYDVHSLPSHNSSNTSSAQSSPSMTSTQSNPMMHYGNPYGNARYPTYAGVQGAGQFRAPQFYPQAYPQMRGMPAPQGQYLYYPSLDQNQNPPQ